MAMTKCGECGRDLSTKAGSCPHCGAPVSALAELHRPLAATEVRKLLGGLVALIAIGVGISVVLSHNDGASGAGEAPIDTSIAELVSAYDQNTLAADNRFKGHSLRLTATVANINTDIANGAYLVLAGGNPFMQPQAHLTDSARAQASHLRPGAEVSLRCIGDGDVAKIPMLQDCAFESLSTSSKLQNESAAAVTQAPGPATVSSTVETAYQMLSRPEFEESGRKFFGGKFDDFKQHLEVSIPLKTEGNYLFGAGCVAHMCGTEEAAFVIDSKSDSVVAIMLTGGRNIDLFGASSLESLPPPLRTWANERHLVVDGSTTFKTQ